MKLTILFLIVLIAGCVSPAESQPEGRTVTGYNSQVLAGDAAPVINFNQADYQTALQSDKLIVLYFYADWCPICKEEVPKMYAAFNELKENDVIAFRVNYNDGQTDDNERALAREHGVAYQHTKIFVKNGERVLKAPDSWEKERYTSEINRYR